MSITLYGIPNCDQVKKARTWLSEHHIDAHFHDFKKAGITAEIIQSWLKKVDRQILINRKGTTWRNLPQAEQNAVIDDQSAIACMIKYPSLIKRPVLVLHGKSTFDILVGFSDDSYQSIAAFSDTE